MDTMFSIWLPAGGQAFKIKARILVPRGELKVDEEFSGSAETLLHRKQQEFKNVYGRYVDAINEYDSAQKLFWLCIALTIMGAVLFYSIDKLSYNYFFCAGIILTLITFPCIVGLKKIFILQYELNILKKYIESSGMRICYVKGNSQHNIEFYQINSIPYDIYVLKPNTPIDFNEYKNI